MRAESRQPRDERILRFELQGQPFALRLDGVTGLADCLGIRRVHGAPAAVMGLTEWRGNLLTVLDLPRLLGRDPVEGRACLVRLAPPLQHMALYLPATVRLVGVGALEAAREEPEAPPTGDVRVLDPLDLVRKLEGELRVRR